ncbi:sulfite exporter TauE/SafE family protein [Bosea sp. (in: a-proteobacteria)]|uniref:sulfite exporter TauE/SafE family protein n=1 Tax=Bosea sp. (in: a-proteobacteria) TaxID=1871050 RepID=UPI002FC93F20
MPADPLFYLVGWATTLLIAIGKGAFGGGLAILGVPLLAFVVEPLQGAIIVALLVAAMDLFAIRSFGVASWSKPDLVWLLPGLAAGIGIGYAVFLMVDARIVTLIIGLTTLAFTAHWFARGRLAPPGKLPVSPGLALLASTASGFTTFVAHAGGPPIAMYLLARGLSKTAFVGTTIAIFMLGNLLKLPPYLSLGLKQPELLWGALALAPAAPLGVWLGRWLHDRLDQKRLFFACYLLLAAAALKLTADAALALLR